MRFSPAPPKYSDEPYDARFTAALRNFTLELARNGLTLEAGARTYYENGEVVLQVIAQDNEAVDERNMSYDTTKALEALVKRCTDVPSVSVLREHIHPANCECAHPSYFVLQSPPEWEGSPVKCGDCGNSVPLYRLCNSVPEREFDDLLMWRRIRRGYFTAYEAGRSARAAIFAGTAFDAAAAYAILKSCVSELSLEGRRLAGVIEAETGILTLYPLFSHYEKPPEHCPQCGSDWLNPYTGAINYQCFCRACRLVM